MSEMIDKLNSFFDSPEGQESIKAWRDKITADDKRLADHIERFHNIHKDNLDEVMNRLINKYKSKEYVNREYKLGYEPRETLFWFMVEYARKYGVVCKDETYFNDFTGEAYYLGSYVIQVMHGQGSVIRIDKIKYITDKVYRLCPNCKHENTKQESLNQYVCRYCDGESDTNW